MIKAPHPSIPILFITIISLFTLFIPSKIYSSVYIYYPLTNTTSPTPPPLTLNDTGIDYATLILGENHTSISVKLYALKGDRNILHNPDFYNDPEGWYFTGRDTVGVWLATYTTSDGSPSSGGVIKINGTVIFSNIYGLIYQPFRAPYSLNNSYIVTRIDYRYEGIFISTDLFVGIYDPSIGGFINSTSIPLSETGDWQDFTFNVDVSLLTPGNEYFLVIGLDSSGWLGIVELYIDWVYLNVSTIYNTFNGYIVAIQVDSGFFYGWLTLESYMVTGNVNVSIWLYNYTLSSSTPIAIMNNVLINGETSILMLNRTDVYRHLIYLDSSLDDGSSITLNMVLYYSPLPDRGVLVSYPITIVIDP